MAHLFNMALKQKAYGSDDLEEALKKIGKIVGSVQKNITGLNTLNATQSIMLHVTESTCLVLAHI